MIKTIETGIKRSQGGLAIIALVMFVGSAQAANVFNSPQFQMKSTGHMPTRIKVKRPIYRYVVKTLKRVRRQGKVNASGIIWNCKKKRCTTKGPWPKPSVTACRKLARLVGPIRSYGRRGHYLSANYIRQCNQKLVRFNRKKIIGVAKRAKMNIAKGNMVSRFSKKERQRAKLFFNRLPVGRAIKSKLSRGKDVRYLVVTNALSGRSHRIERRTWTGKILLPDLRKGGKVKRVYFTKKRHKGIRSKKMTAWFIENPDRSLSRQIRNSRGQLTGNITFTRDGSVRIGIDLNGDQVADLYETIISSGEHTILASPAGQAALEHFRNGGKNSLCNSGAVGASPAGGSSGGMISGGDKTAMQVVCGRKDGNSSNGGSAAGGGSRGMSGDPAGRAMDAMCQGVLSRNRGRPGAGGIAMDGPDVIGILVDFLPLDPVTSTAIVLYRDRDKSWQETVIDVGFGLLGPVGAFVDASAASTAGDDAHSRNDYVNEADKDLAAFERERDSGDGSRPDPAKVNSACAAGSTSRYCGAWHQDHDSDQSGSGNTGGGNASAPGPDQQNNPDTALLAMCQARAKGKAWWASITKDTRYVRQLCENSASQPNPAGMAGSAGKASSATLGDSYGSSVTLTTYCGQHGGQRTSPPSPERLAGQSRGRNCGRTESPGTDGRCHGVGTQFNGGNAGKVNVSYGAVIGIPLFDPRVTNPAVRH